MEKRDGISRNQHYLKRLERLIWLLGLGVVGAISADLLYNDLVWDFLRKGNENSLILSPELRKFPP